jgi:hypothetical protein
VVVVDDKTPMEIRRVEGIEQPENQNGWEVKT